MDGDRPLPKGLIETGKGLYIAIHADAKEKGWLQQVTAWCPDIATLSAPKVAHGPKLDRNPACIRPAVLFLRKPYSSHPPYPYEILLIENVPGFNPDISPAS